MLQVGDVRSFLPVQALQSIKHLEMTIRAEYAPVWPTPWTNLTSLEINVIGYNYLRGDRGDFYMLPPLANLTAFLSLKTVRQLIFKLTFISTASFRQGVSDALCAFASMSLELQIVVIRVHWRKKQQPLENVMEVIDEFFSEVCHVMPGMHLQCTAPEDIVVPYAVGGRDHIITRMTFRWPA